MGEVKVVGWVRPGSKVAHLPHWVVGTGRRGESACGRMRLDGATWAEDVPGARLCRYCKSRASYRAMWLMEVLEVWEAADV